MRGLFFFLLSILFFSLQGCSWICRFYIANPTNETIAVEMKLSDACGSFPIFHYPFYYYGKLRQYKLRKNNRVDFENSKEINADTLEIFSHYKVQIPPHTAIEIGQLQNDNYEKHDQYFINGRTFNMEHLRISKKDKNVEITPSNFDNYFGKRKYGEVYFVI